MAMNVPSDRRTPLDHWGWQLGPGGLAIEGHSVAALAGRVKTPFYLLVSSRVGHNVDLVRSALGPNERVFYALKTNGFAPVARMIARGGMGAEVISARELRSALDLGFANDRLIFNGPGKSDEDLTLALQCGCLVQVESASEARALARLAGDLGLVAKAGVRLNPDIVDAHARDGVRMGARDSIFGLDPEGDEFRDVVATFRASHIEWRTLSAHIGTGIRSMDPYRRLALTMNEVRQRLRAAGIFVNGLDLGGGFAVPSEVRIAEGLAVPPFDETASFASILQAVRDAVSDDPPAELLFEPGRLIVSDTMHLVAKVVRKKKTAFSEYLILDASAHQNGQFVRRGYHELVNVRRPTAAADTQYTLTGPLCADFDVFQRGRWMPATEEGDLVTILDVGAYNYSAQSSWSFVPAPCLVLEGSEPQLWPAFDRAPVTSP